MEFPKGRLGGILRIGVRRINELHKQIVIQKTPLSEIYRLVHDTFNDANDITDDSLDTLLMIHLIAKLHSIDLSHAKNRVPIESRKELRKAAKKAFSLTPPPKDKWDKTRTTEEQLLEFCDTYLRDNSSNPFLFRHCQWISQLQKRVNNNVQPVIRSRLTVDEKDEKREAIEIKPLEHISIIIRDVFARCDLPREDQLVIRLRTFFKQYHFDQIPILLLERAPPVTDIFVLNQKLAAQSQILKLKTNFQLIIRGIDAKSTREEINAVRAASLALARAASYIPEEVNEVFGMYINFLSETKLFNETTLDIFNLLSPFITKGELVDQAIDLTITFVESKSSTQKEFYLLYDPFFQQKPKAIESVIDSYIDSYEDSSDQSETISVFKLSCLYNYKWKKLLEKILLLPPLSEDSFKIIEKSLPYLKNILDNLDFIERKDILLSLKNLRDDQDHSITIPDWAPLFKSDDVWVLENILATLKLPIEIREEKEKESKVDMDFTHWNILNFRLFITHLDSITLAAWKTKILKILHSCLKNLFLAILSEPKKTVDLISDLFEFSCLFSSISHDPLDLGMTLEEQTRIIEYLQDFKNNELDSQNSTHVCYVTYILAMLDSKSSSDFINTYWDSIKQTILSRYCCHSPEKWIIQDVVDKELIKNTILGLDPHNLKTFLSHRECLMEFVRRLIKEKEEVFIIETIIPVLKEALDESSTDYLVTCSLIQNLSPIFYLCKNQQIITNDCLNYLLKFFQFLLVNFDYSRVGNLFFEVYKSLGYLFRSYRNINSSYVENALKVLKVLLSQLPKASCDNEIYEISNLMIAIIVHAVGYRNYLLDQLEEFVHSSESSVSAITKINFTSCLYSLRVRVFEEIDPELREHEVVSHLQEITSFPISLCQLINDYCDESSSLTASLSFRPG